MTPYLPSRVTEKVGFSCYWKTTLNGLVSSGHILDKDPTMSCTPIACVTQTAHDPRKSQLGSNELPKYAHWAVLPLEHSVRHSTVPRNRWSGTIFLPSEHPCLTAIHKDGLGPSQAPPTTVSPLQLVSYGVVQVTDYEATIFSSRREVQVPYPADQVRSLVSPIRTLQHLFWYFLHRIRILPKYIFNITHNF